jgi:hypothetical protein
VEASIGDFSGPGRSRPVGSIADREDVDVPVHDEPGSGWSAACEIADYIWHGGFRSDDLGSGAMGLEVGDYYVCG